MTLQERFRAELDRIAAYLALAEERGDGVRVVLSYKPGASVDAKVEAFPASAVARKT